MLSIVQNGKPWSLIIMPKRKLRGFQLRVFSVEYSAKRKTLEFDHNAEEKT